MRPGVFRLAQGSWNELPSANLLTPLNIERPDEPRFITHAVGTTMTFSAYALVILEKPVFTTQVAPRTICTLVSNRFVLPPLPLSKPKLATTCDAD